MDALPATPQRALPRSRWAWLYVGTLLALCVYYLNYGAAFDEGDIEGGGGVATLLGRAAAVALIVGGLRPFRFRVNSALLLVLLYLACSCSLLLSVGSRSTLNDVLFVNTLLQLPVLMALTSTVWAVDFARWLRFVGLVLALQTAGDAVVWLLDASLWISAAFVGGVGNPSSFGLLCSVLYAFVLFHPQAGRYRWLPALVLCVGALLSMALFAVLAVVVLTLVWLSGGWRRVALACVTLPIAALSALTLVFGEDDGDVGFIEHKLSALGALVGLVDYDVESSASVSLRLDMHRDTLAAIQSEPLRLLWGHLQGQAYWPMDSQVLTYLGSFGAPMLVAFLLLHAGWLFAAWRLRARDGGFAFGSLLLVGLIFLTNRILDYFPVATLYFIVVATTLRAPPWPGFRRAVPLRPAPQAP
jgi:hypothetical protein